MYEGFVFIISHRFDVSIGSIGISIEILSHLTFSTQFLGHSFSNWFHNNFVFSFLFEMYDCFPLNFS